MGMMYSRGLVAGYPFENTANDILGINNGTVYGATYVDGQCGRALSLDGVDDYVDLGNNYNIGLGSITVSCWVTRIVNNNLKILWSKAAGNDVNNYGILYNAETLIFRMGLASNDIIVTAALLPVNTFGLVTYVVDRNAGMLNAYVNAKLVGTRDVSSMAAVNMVSSAPFLIGRYGNISGYFWGGKIDSFKIYNKALTQSEIQRDYLNLPIL